MIVLWRIVRGAWLSLPSKRRAEYGREYGPCYDFCPCAFCWRGWRQSRFEAYKQRFLAVVSGRER